MTVLLYLTFAKSNSNLNIIIILYDGEKKANYQATKQASVEAFFPSLIENEKYVAKIIE